MKHLLSKSLSLTVILFALLSCSVKQGEHIVLFESGNSDSIPYRIPALSVLPGGGLVAFTDYRHCREDIGFGRVDIHSRSSRNGGRTWGNETVVIEGTGVPGAVDCGFGDPAVVADRETGELLLMLVCGQTIYWAPETTRSNPNRITALRSSDGGKTWGQWTEMTEEIYSLFDDCPKGCVQSCFIASGRIFQSSTIKVGSHYRIYAAMCARPNGNRVIYSDDFGRSWRALGGADQYPAPQGNEPKCEELPDGSVVLSSRAYSGRIFNIYRYEDVANGRGEWGVSAFSGEAERGCAALDNSCNGEILSVPAVRKSDGRKVNLFLQSVPLGPERRDVGIYYKELPEDVDGITPETLASDWSGPYKVSSTQSAYSTMVMLRTGNIAFYFEETLKDDGKGYDMVFVELSLDTVTGELYRKY